MRRENRGGLGLMGILLAIKDLQVRIGTNLLLNGSNLEIEEGETVILFGANGSGKTSLLMAIMGMPDYQVIQGTIHFRGRNITGLPPYERARLGMGMSFQRPPTIHGLSLRQLVGLCGREQELKLTELAGRLNMQGLLDRDVNAAFSGGEIKRSEILQLLAQNPSLLLFDEPESGVDLENMGLIGATLRDMLQGREEQGASGLVITHTGHILNYIDSHRGVVLHGGRLCYHGAPQRILTHIRQYGYGQGVAHLLARENNHA